MVGGTGEAVLTDLYNELALPQLDLARVEGLTWKDTNNVIHTAAGPSSFDVAKIAIPVHRPETAANPSTIHVVWMRLGAMQILCLSQIL